MLLFEQDFYDYRTGDVNGSDVVDLHRTGMSYYDDFLSNDAKILNYLKNNKNLVGEVVMMSPNEYFKLSSEYGFPNSHPSVETLKQQRYADQKTIQHLKDVLTVAKKKFPMPMINKADAGQEGLHRMLVIGDMFGWDHKVPVLVVDWADKQRAFEEQKRARIQKIEYNIGKAVQHALWYKFKNIDELKDQIQSELDNQFEYSDDIKPPVEFELTSDEQTKEFTVTIGAAKYSFDYEDVQFIEPSDKDELDDLDFEVDDDFLVRYFGDDWRETYPHLKDKFNIKESFDFDSSNIKKMDEYIQQEFGQDTPGEGCIFIHPNGKFINIYPKLDDHEDLCYWLEENGFNFEDNPSDAQWFIEDFKYIRCRNSLHLCFIDLPNTITNNQLYSLEEWMESRVKSDSIQISVPDGKWRKYNLDEYFPEDLIKIIKRYYASGTLY